MGKKFRQVGLIIDFLVAEHLWNRLCVNTDSKPKLQQAWHAFHAVCIHWVKSIPTNKQN